MVDLDIDGLYYNLTKNNKNSQNRKDYLVCIRPSLNCVIHMHFIEHERIFKIREKSSVKVKKLQTM